MGTLISLSFHYDLTSISVLYYFRSHLYLTLISLWFHIDFMLIRRESLVHEGKGKAYDKREKGKAGDPKGKRERPKTLNLIRDPTRHPDRAHARTTRNDFPVRGGLPKGELTPPNLRYCSTGICFVLSRRVT